MPKKEEQVQEEEIKDSTETVEEVKAEVEVEAESESAVDVVSPEAPSESVESEELSTVQVGEEASDEAYDPDKPVTVKPIKFASFEDLNQTQGEINKNLDILMDIKLQLTVELGRTELPIKKVLELTRGSIIELEKVAGEPVELYANGKLVAHGEVVVIEDNFGLRITSITDPEDRLKGIG